MSEQTAYYRGNNQAQEEVETDPAQEILSFMQSRAYKRLQCCVQEIRIIRRYRNALRNNPD